eukprot:g10198.t1
MVQQTQMHVHLPAKQDAAPPRWPALVHTLVGFARSANSHDWSSGYVTFPASYVPALDPRVGLRTRKGLDVLLPRTRPLAQKTLPRVLFVYSTAVAISTRDLYRALGAYLAWHGVCSVALFDLNSDHDSEAIVAPPKGRRVPSSSARGGAKDDTTARAGLPTTKKGGRQQQQAVAHPAGGGGKKGVGKKGKQVGASPAAIIGSTSSSTPGVVNGAAAAGAPPPSDESGDHVRTSGRLEAGDLARLRAVFEEAPPDYLIGDSLGGTMCLLLLSQLLQERNWEEQAEEARKKRVNNAAADINDDTNDLAAALDEGAILAQVDAPPLHKRARRNNERGGPEIFAPPPAPAPPIPGSTSSTTSKEPPRSVKPIVPGGLLLLSPWSDLSDYQSPSWRTNADVDYLSAAVLKRVALQFAESCEQEQEVSDGFYSTRASSSAPPERGDGNSSRRIRFHPGNREQSSDDFTSSHNTSESDHSSSDIEEQEADRLDPYGAAALEAHRRKIEAGKASKRARGSNKRESVEGEDDVLDSESGASTDGEHDMPLLSVQHDDEVARRFMLDFKAMLVGGETQTGTSKGKRNGKDLKKEVGKSSTRASGRWVSVSPGARAGGAGVDHASRRGGARTMKTEKERLQAVSPVYACDFSRLHYALCPRIHIVSGCREVLRDQIKQLHAKLKTELSATGGAAASPPSATTPSSTAIADPKTRGRAETKLRLDEFSDLGHSFLPMWSAFEPRRLHGDVHMALNAVLRFLAAPKVGGDEVELGKNEDLVSNVDRDTAASTGGCTPKSTTPALTSKDQRTTGAAARREKAAFLGAARSLGGPRPLLCREVNDDVPGAATPNSMISSTSFARAAASRKDQDVDFFGFASCCPLRMHVIQDFSPPKQGAANYCENCLRDPATTSAALIFGASNKLRPCTNLGSTGSCGSLRLCDKCRESHVCDAWISLLRDMCVVGSCTPGDVLVLHAPSSEYPIEKLFFVPNGQAEGVARTTVLYAGVPYNGSSWADQVSSWWASTSTETLAQQKMERETKSERRYSELLVFLAALLEKVMQKLGRTSTDIAEDFPFATVENFDIEYLAFQHLRRFLCQLEVLARTSYREIKTMHTGLLSLYRRGFEFLQLRERGPTIVDRTLVTDEANVKTFIRLYQEEPDAEFDASYLGGMGEVGGRRGGGTTTGSSTSRSGPLDRSGASSPAWGGGGAASANTTYTGSATSPTVGQRAADGAILGRSIGMGGAAWKPPASATTKAILAGALFMKGGLLGSFIPFTTLWTHLHGYSPTQVGLLAGADILFSILLVPVYGSILDTWKCHNYGLIVTMVATGVLKGLYVPFADSFFLRRCGLMDFYQDR